jgi:LacI family transcriptional regulator
MRAVERHGEEDVAVTTIKEVAKLAGIAISTASDALNGKPGVSPKTRQRALEAARELGYVPNPVARGLVRRATRNIGIVLSGPSSFEFFTNPVFFEMIRSATGELTSSGYHAVLNVITTEEEPEAIPRIARSRLVEALILVGTRRGDSELAQLLEGISIPAVTVIRDPLGPNALAVSVDNHRCGYLATRYLIEQGHETIGYVGDLPGVSLAEERLAGYRQALRESGITYAESLVVPADFYQESGSAATRELLRRASKRPTAIFAANDLMALGAIELLQERGLDVPEDVSIVGCDDIPNLHLLKTPLTTISLPFAKIGARAAALAVRAVEKTDGLPPQISLQPQLKIRSSVKPLRRA